MVLGFVGCYGLMPLLALGLSWLNVVPLGSLAHDSPHAASTLLEAGLPPSPPSHQGWGRRLSADAHTLSLDGGVDGARVGH